MLGTIVCFEYFSHLTKIPNVSKAGREGIISWQLDKLNSHNNEGSIVTVNALCTPNSGVKAPWDLMETLVIRS